MPCTIICVYIYAPAFLCSDHVDGASHNSQWFHIKYRLWGSVVFKRFSAHIYRESCPIKKTKPPGAKGNKKKERKKTSSLLEGTILWRINSGCSITLPLYQTLSFFLSIQTSGHYKLTAVCRHVGRNLLSLQITAHCLLPLSLHTCTLEDVIKWSVFVVVVVEQDQWCRNVRLCWLTDWQMLWASRRWVTDGTLSPPPPPFFLCVCAAVFSFSEAAREGGTHPCSSWVKNWKKTGGKGTWEAFLGLSNRGNLI